MVVDASGRKVEIADSSRIVAVGGAVTEILYALGVQDRIVAVDQTSSFPPAATEKPNVGYMRAISPEGVLALAPTVILAIEDSGPPDAIEVLRQASVPIVLVPEARTPEEVIEKIRFIAEAVGASERGETLARAVREDFTALAAMRERISEQRSAVFALALGEGTAIVAGRDTSAEAIFRLAGIDNALGAVSGFKPTSDEAILAAAPDAVVVMAERNHALNAETVFALPGFAATPAAKSKTLVALPGLYLLGFGPRTAHAARDLAAALYPELGLEPLPARPWTAGKDAVAP